MTLHPHPQTAAIGGAIATTLARRSDARITHDAVTSAATLVTVGGYEHALRGALVRNVWAAVGTANGMRAADWAECGLGGLPDGAYDVFTTLLGQAADPAALDHGLGETWAIGSGYHKVHACCQSTHSAVEATQAAMALLPAGRTHADVVSVLLESHRPQMSNPRPQTTLAARFSFEHVLATVQVHGHAGADAFAASTLDDPAIVRLRERIRLVPYAPVRPRPLDRPARVTLTLCDGAQVTGECLSARGGPDRPFDDAQIRAKAQGITGERHPRFVEAVDALERLDPATLAQPWSAWIAAALAR
jgi:2-methylcitrate dehydratase PrpD